MQMKTKDIKVLRIKLLEEQSGICKICGDELVYEEAVLDHCHKTGRIRGVIHRGCNLFLGKIENNMKRFRITEERLEGFICNLISYKNTLREEIHPSYGKKRRAKRSPLRRRLSK